MKILVVDDEREIRTVLRLLFENQGYTVIEAENGRDAVLKMSEMLDIDLCIMDIMMPEISGLEAAESIRRFSNVPLLFLTAKSLESDKLMAYDVGGDDYIVKPFSPRELLMKVTALIRRYNHYSGKEADGEAIALSSGVIIHPSKREVIKNGESVDIRDKEFEVLLFLARNRGKTVSAATIYESVWNEMSLPSSNNTVTVHILNLRRKLEDGVGQKLIRTVWGRGYQID
ncbi:MAG: response regulator transcription factor [Clostridia bacterium]|nr:response regulator transcription factor [Clostridia bacterium]